MVGSSAAGLAGRRRRAEAERGRVIGGGWLAGLAPGVSRSGSGPFGRDAARRPDGVGGQRGHAVGEVASAEPGSVLGGRRRWPSAAEHPRFPSAAGAPFGETPPPAVPSDAASSGGAVLAGADLASAGRACSPVAAWAVP